MGPADYVLFVDRQAVGVIEAKKLGTTLTGVEWQTRKYQTALPDELPAFLVDGALPFGYESTGTETRFTCGLDPSPTSRRVFSFHRPETLARWHEDHVRLHQGEVDGGKFATLRGGLQLLPELEPSELWPAQEEAIRNLEQSLKQNRPRALIQMATGSGKTFTAANICYRLLRHAGANRILFLVDRANLARQTIREFKGFNTPDDGRKFTELYNARRLTSPHLDIGEESAAKVHVATIQRIYSILRGEELDDNLDEQSSFEMTPERPVEVAYNPSLPIEAYDVIIIDECHRSIYGVWRQVLEYFDAFLIGLTATPGNQTFGFFDQNLVMEYGHEAAVADRVNVDFDVFRIRTKITESGSQVEAGEMTEFRDRETREKRMERLDEDIEYASGDLDRKVVAPDQIRTVIRTLRNSMPMMFPDRAVRDDGRLEWVPKTLIFAKDDSHADDIVQTVREEFGLSNQGAVKITYKAASGGHQPEDLLREFRNGHETRIAVTVDMIATGTDVKPIECVVFMRMVKSRSFFEQMKGRGVRVISDDDLRIVTPGATTKDRFVLVDAVGVTEAMLHDSTPLDRKRRESFDKLLNLIGLGVTDEDVVSSVASRLARLDKRISGSDRTELEEIGGISLPQLAGQLLESLDPERHHAAAQAATGLDDPDADQVADARKKLVEEALQPLAANPEFREKLIEVRRRYEQVIDSNSRDQVISGEFSKEATDRARRTVESFRQFIEDNRDEITALQVLYNQPYGGGLTFHDIRELANAISRPPRSWTPELLWEAYETLDASKVRGSGLRVSTDLVSLVRYALGTSDELIAYTNLVDERFDAWLLQQENAGNTFSPDQLVFLHIVKDHLAGSLTITNHDLMAGRFSQHGGLGRARQLFGDDLRPLLDELTQALAA
ncbi:DEAD/DEAH box helicase family protein [Candidatus Poriferisocius sp.]|uniref:type I restriction endonuclease subunit R n=1 Tax=Candidatus Poriferisocius sp. TaxID=3101276 RepID=UPI003B5C0BBF